MGVRGRLRPSRKRYCSNRIRQPLDDLERITHQVARLLRIIIQIVELPGRPADNGRLSLRLRKATRTQVKYRLPFSLSNSENAVAAMMHRGLANGSGDRFLQEQRQDIEAVFTCARRSKVSLRRWPPASLRGRYGRSFRCKSCPAACDPASAQYKERGARLPRCPIFARATSRWSGARSTRIAVAAGSPRYRL